MGNRSGTAPGFGQSILKAPAVRYAVFKKLSIHIPVLTHKSAASEACPLMITAGLSAIRFDRAGKGFFYAQMIHLDASCICLGLYPPMRAHFLDRGELISQMVATFLFWKSYCPLHRLNTCIYSFSAFFNQFFSQFLLTVSINLRLLIIITIDIN